MPISLDLSGPADFGVCGSQNNQTCPSRGCETFQKPQRKLTGGKKAKPHEINFISVLEVPGTHVGKPRFGNESVQWLNERSHLVYTQAGAAGG